MKRKIFAVVMAVAMMTTATASMCFAATGDPSTGKAKILLNTPSSSNITNNDPDNIDFTVSEKISITVTDSEKAAATVTDLTIAATSNSKSAIDVKSITADAGSNWSLVGYDANTFAGYKKDDNHFAMQVTTVTNSSGTANDGTVISASATPNADMSPSGYTPADDIKTILKSSDMVVKFDGLVTQTSVAQSSTNIGTCIVTVEASTVA